MPGAEGINIFRLSSRRECHMTAESRLHARTPGSSVEIERKRQGGLSREWPEV